ncbi:hypothetical protein MTR67_014106 [Solanum verrucosum]|uniref:Uncharacterized protein n=1 Tax=Solanum verrucosum TaxID=315347 RepID=A0AAF0TIJ9_SOLVR|nr:hypothetical protein MTR67_014106 [Solanum verrucosum]
MGFGRRWSYCLVVLAQVLVMELLSLVWPAGFIRRSFCGSDDRVWFRATPEFRSSKLTGSLLL